MDTRQDETDTQEDEATPARPQSPYVSNLRLQVALSRKTRQQQWDLSPSVGTWLSPRSPRQDRLSVSFASTNEVVPISHRAADKVERVLLNLSFKGTCAKPFKLEGVDASLTVRNVKELCEARCSLSPDMQRLLFKGVILQDNHRIQDTAVTDNSVLFLVKGAAPPASFSSSKDSQPELSGSSDPDDWEALANEGPAMASDARPLWHNVSGLLCSECGVNPGRLLTEGLCSICFRELVMRENAALKKRKEEAKRREEEEEAKRQREEQEQSKVKKQVNTTRCFQCNKKTGLTGFECKCGYTFCAAHRHAEDHGCAFDHKAHGRQILAQQNPTPKFSNSGLD